MRPNKPWTLKEITNYLQQKSAKYKLLSSTYKTQFDRLKWKCLSCNTIFVRNWKAMLLTIKGNQKEVVRLVPKELPTLSPTYNPNLKMTKDL